MPGGPEGSGFGRKKDLRPETGTKVFLQALRGTTQIAPGRSRAPLEQAVTSLNRRAFFGPELRGGFPSGSSRKAFSRGLSLWRGVGGGFFPSSLMNDIALIILFRPLCVK